MEISEQRSANMQAEQPKRNLDLAVQAAIASPRSANLLQLLSDFDDLLNHLPPHLHLKRAGDLLAQLTDILAARADQLLEDWEEKHNPVQAEPVLTTAMLQEVLRHTMSLNLEAVLGDSPLRHQTPQSSNSVIGTVEKDNLLAFLEQVDQKQAQQEALAIAHEEDVTAWVDAIGQWQQAHHNQAVSLPELQRSLQMPLIQVWLALLLGGFTIEQRGEFYQVDGIWLAQGFRCKK